MLTYNIPEIEHNRRYKVSTAVKKLGITRRTLYNYFESENLSYEFDENRSHRLVWGYELLKLWFKKRLNQEYRYAAFEG